MAGRWGKAGQRLTAEQITTRAQTAATGRALAVDLTRRRDAEAYRKWAAGQVIPHAITTCLNLRSLYGPEVDIACGTTEPDVDMWEAGTLYPTWEQLVLLGKLTDMPLMRFFIQPAEVGTVIICGRKPVAGVWHEPEPVLNFTHAAIADRLKPAQPALFH